MEYHIAPIADVAQSLQTSPDGLDPATAQRRLDEVGPNQLVDVKRKTVGQLLLHQFTDVMILVLIAAAAISFLVGERNSAYVILAIVVLNAIIGFVQEYQATKAVEALKKMVANQARVLRNGQTLDVAAVYAGAGRRRAARSR